jgi:glycosyltransferase involved in cell wall biosynthesis
MDCLAKAGLDMSANVVQVPVAEPEDLVSILVPSYNHERYVIECLESIKSLNYLRLELILSDDCSRDGTYLLAEQWAEKNADRFERTLIVRQEKNLGITKNLQFLFDRAGGDYLAYIASDDSFLESAIGFRVKLLQENPNFDAVFGNAQLISDSSAVLKERFIPDWIARELTSKRLLVPSLLLNWHVPGPVMMLRRSAVLNGGSLGILPTDLKGEDKYIYLRLASSGKLHFENVIVAKYRMVQESMSRAPSMSRSVLEYNINSDERNMCLLSGFNRYVAKTRIARYQLELSKDNVALYDLKRLFLRCLVTQFRVVLFVCALFRFRK